jgi:hypothetical protein
MARCGIAWMAAATLWMSMWRKMRQRMKSEPATMAALTTIPIRLQPIRFSTLCATAKSASNVCIL